MANNDIFKIVTVKWGAEADKNSDDSVSDCPKCGDQFHSLLWNVCRECREGAPDDEKCGFCGAVIIETSNTAQIRTPEAPNPFCDTCCANSWEVNRERRN